MRVWSLMAALCLRNVAHGKSDKHKSMVEDIEGVGRLFQIQAEVVVGIELAGLGD